MTIQVSIKNNHILSNVEDDGKYNLTVKIYETGMGTGLPANVIEVKPGETRDIVVWKGRYFTVSEE